jgi:hypothetical protein
VDGNEVLEPSRISAAQAQTMVSDAATFIALVEILLK